MTVFAAGCSSYKYQKAQAAYDNMAYHKAVQYYSAYLKKYDNREAMLRLADSYRQMHNYTNAEYWYGRALTGQTSNSSDKYSYATALKMNGKYDQAKIWFTKYLGEVPGNEVALAQLQSCDSIAVYNRYARLYQVEQVAAFGNVSNFSMIPYEDGFVFNSEIHEESKAKTNPWNGRPYLNIMYARLNNDQLQAPTSFSPALNTPFHNGPVAFSADYRRIYYSRSNTNNNNSRLVKNKDGVSTIKIYTAERSGNDWTNIKEMPFNSSEYSTGHPTLSADGNTMYFISDMPGSLGKTDIYISTLTNGQWSAPVNLGSNVNTPGFEMFPYYYKDSSGLARLYYSSDGLPGMGGLDMYFIEQQADGSWGSPVHLGAPFNSSKDDFALTLKNNAAMGYFSSSRDGSGDIDKLYAFNKDQLRFIVDGIVYNKANNKTVSNARVEMINNTNHRHDILLTHEDGTFSAPLEINSDYAFVAGKKNYLPGRTQASTIGRESDEVIKVTIYLDSLADVLALANIYYDFDKYNIRPDAAEQLDKLAQIMKENPDLNLELGAHTDCRGTDNYNMKLSEKRARSVVTYLAERGITPYRLYAKWYGESMLVNECVDGVTCSPDKHQQNRRTEFKELSELARPVYSSK